MSTKTVVFVHGLFMSHNSWNHWVEYFGEKGYKAITIPYPGRDKSVEQLRREHPDVSLGNRTFGEVLDHHIDFINKIDEAPVIIGHSLGGLLVQLMLNRGVGVAGIAIDSAPPMGVLTTKLSFLRANFAVLNPFNSSSKPYMMSLKEFQYAFANGMSPEKQQCAYDENVVPESLRIARGTLTPSASIDFKKQHAPLLMIAGENDNIIPPSLNQTNFKRYEASKPSVTEFKEFAGRNHFLVGAEGWQEIASYILNWIEMQQV